jgi:methyl-accepting chemotaxis protein
MNSRMTAGKKLALIGAFLIVLTITLGVSTLVGLAGFNRIVKSLSEDSLEGLSHCSRVEGHVMELRGDAWRHIASSDPKTIAEMDQQIQGLKEEINAGLADVEKSVFQDQERQIYVKIKPALERYYRAWEDVAAVSRTGNNELAIKKYMAEADGPFHEVKQAIEAETEFNRKADAVNTAAAASTGARMQWLTWLILIISVVAGGGIFYVVVRGINKVLNRTVSELAEGAEQIISASS